MIFQIHQSSITLSNYSILEIIWRTKTDINFQKINDEISYFNVVVKNIYDLRQQTRISKREISFESEGYENLTDNFDIDEKISSDTLIGWIDLIENEKLHKAVKSLPVEDQLFISYIVKERCTQRELETIYKVDPSVIYSRFRKIIKNIKKFIQKRKVNKLLIFIRKCAQKTP